MRSRSSPSPERKPISSRRPTKSYGSDCQTRSVSGPSSASRCQKRGAPSQPSLSCTAVTPRDAAIAEPLAHRVHELVVGREQVAVAEQPGGLLAQDARRLAVAVDLDHASVDPELAVCLGERGRVEPERVVVARHERGRRIAGDRVERLARRLDGGRPVAAAPAASAEPATGLDRPGRFGHALKRLVERGRVLEAHLPLGERPRAESARARR